ncbi:Sensor kinase-phosphotransferase KdpD (fragment) [Magnetospirillum sp. LM-5]|uniref:DUF4118 domain-containing protein n=1 Tax=Magnetospirillum sp. LM-5 TaxID=2681466 RepID=UPI001384A0DE
MHTFIRGPMPLTILAPAAATLLGAAIDGAGLPIANISVGYLMAVLVVARHCGRWPAVAASLISFFAFNFFFTEPRYTLAISDVQNILTVVFFLIAAIIVSNLTARLRHEIDVSRESARRTQNLYEFASRVSAAATLDDVAWAAVHHVAATIQGTSLVLLPRQGELTIAAGYPPEDRLDDVSWSAARWAWDNARPAGRGHGVLPGADWLFLPMRTQAGPVGLLGVRIAAAPPESMKLLDALADQVAVAIERTNLAGAVEDALLTAERERLRSALLSSLSHDLRTPLATILGAASTLSTLDDALDPANRRELAGAIEDEALRLNRFVQNLLDMTRLGTGALVPRCDWTDLGDILDNARHRVEAAHPGRVFRMMLPRERPLARVDAVLLEQALFNLLDNAGKYAPPGTPVTVTLDGGIITIDDQGPGIPESEREAVFDMFHRVAQTDGQVAGTGLGLAICRGILAAHGGSVAIEDGPGGKGCRFRVTLALTPPPDIPSEAP